MKWRTKWVLAILLTIGVYGVAKMESQGVIQKPVTPYVTSGKDFVAIKKWIASMVGDPDTDTIAVMAGDPHQEQPFSGYDSMQPYKNGVIVSYPQSLPIEAQGNGLVVFTGFTRQSGKTITVLYDDGDEVTYGFVETFSKLPYTTVKRGDTLAMMGEGTVFLMVKRDGVPLDASLMPTYFSGEGK
ncbi:peptidoglycan DD-metalloendopeptidase family protein [Sporosarcina sp. 179-K 3D1 HS]|uniref:peptidoglycan DD-metalloendopeptidase family protein n=1 Tax=Sporosarcina sp. 179-K 3D1 HS TaxID=3232169 RepID=UPI0039A3018E